FGAFFGGSAFGGGAGGRTRGRPGRDISYSLQISFEEAAFGVEKTIELRKRGLCETCSGSGAKVGTKPESCRTCGGSGQVRMQQGFFAITTTCNSCSGAGEVISEPCDSCNGSGTTPIETELLVKVPPGIDHGQRLKLRGEGEPGMLGGPSGDLYVKIAIQPHSIFKREGSELVCQVPITYPAAVLGAEIEVPTLDGLVKLKVPSGTQSGKVFRLRGKGIPVLGSSRRGDQHVQIQIEIPKKISDEERQLLEKLREVQGKEFGSESKGFIDKVKELFG
ncbi:MAG: molecular chaperone DnaJ, partial [Bdellovibrionales bacterium]|nr:molecular chaperone DnaJ [Bdellovibrionales bacterium]